MRKKWEYLPIATKAESEGHTATRTRQILATNKIIDDKIEDIPDGATNEEMALMLNAATIDMLKEINITLAIIADHLTSTDSRK